MTVRWRIVVPVAAVATAVVWWATAPASPPPVAPASTTPATAAASTPVPEAAPSPAGPRRGMPLSAAALGDRRAELALWRQRLERAQQVLAAYRAATRYPFDSRPAREHGDQWNPHPLITNDLPLRMPGGSAIPGLRVRTTQQKVYASANDTVALTVTATDDSGNVLPLRILSSVAHGAAGSAAPGARPAAHAPVVTQAFVDDGSLGDARAGDGTFTARLDPAGEGFGDYAGLIRTELTVQSGSTQGYVAFDVVYTPGVPATWSGPAREALRDGSLDIDLPVDVAEAGRYVVTGRVDDAHGQPFAFVSFNDVLATGPRQVRLTMYGRLVRDLKPAFPLVLHDVDGFLLREDAYPDRVLMPARDGVVYTTRRYTAASFSDAAYASDETARYLAEYGKDVAQAQQQVDQLQASTGP
ncbi:MAG: choice-of-anchor X domain-containing protein [Burkholderiaceae bacterium]